MTAPDHRERLRATFTEDAELYDRLRPGYPPALFEDLARAANLRPAASVLEIGCGTGQATQSLAQRGYRVTAIDIGEAMIAVARRRLQTFPNVELAVANFEAWPLPQSPFDAVVSATAFHWIDPSVRLARTASALRPGGALALITTEHVAGGDTEFFAEAQSCYERWDPSTPPGLRLVSAENIETDTREIDESGLFEPTQRRRYLWAQTYSAVEYRDLLLTYSGHRALDAPSRLALLECITNLIETRYSGRITKQYMNELIVARRSVSPAAAR